jgi:hypothetical protein
VQLLTCERLFASQQALRSLEQRDRRTERAVRLRHLGPNRPATEHDQTAWDSARGGDLAAGPRLGLGQPRDRGHRRTATGRDHDRLASRTEQLTNPHAALALEASMASNQRDTPVLEPRNHTRVIHVVNDLIPARKFCVDVDLTGHGLGRARNAARLGQRVSRTQQRLRGHARIRGALATHELGLDDGNPVALLCQAPRQHFACRAGADYDHVKRSRAQFGPSQ